MSKKKKLDIAIIDNQALAAQLVRSWRDNFDKEAGNIPPLLIIGSKCLLAYDIFSNIAIAIENISRVKSTIT